MFDVNAYQESKDWIIGRLKERLNWEENEGFLADGLVSPTVYGTQKLHVAAILSESYGYSESKIVDIEEQEQYDVLGIHSPDQKTAKRLPALLWYLYEELDSGEQITDVEILADNIPNLLTSDTTNILRINSTIRRFAWINVKKQSRATSGESGQTNQIFEEVVAAGKRDADLLKEQLSSLECRLVLVLGKAAQTVYDYTFPECSKSQSPKGTKLAISRDGTVAVYYSHPSFHSDWSKAAIVEKYREIMSLIEAHNLLN